MRVPFNTRCLHKFLVCLFVCLFVCLLLLFFITLNCKSCSPGVSSEQFTNCINLKSKNCLVIRSVLYSSHDINSFFDRIAIRDLRHFENIFREQNATKTNRASLRCAIFAFCCLLFWRTHTWILTTEAMNSLKHEKENNKIFILLKTNVTLTKSASRVCHRIDNKWRHKMFKLKVNSFHCTVLDILWRHKSTDNRKLYAICFLQQT